MSLPICAPFVPLYFTYHLSRLSRTVTGRTRCFPQGRFSLYALAALLPLLPAKQRPTEATDWMTTDAEIACPDPHRGARFRITRTGRSTFRHGETTAVPLRPQ
jgi:uncharacterized repeat protein (TIGR04076 family)